jgi:hypothetical protein
MHTLNCTHYPQQTCSIVVVFAYIRLFISKRSHSRTDRSVYLSNLASCTFWAKTINFYTIRIMCGLLSLQLLVAIAHNGLCLQQLLYGFLVAPDPTAYFDDNAHPTHVIQTTAYMINVCMRWFSDSSFTNFLNL